MVGRGGCDVVAGAPPQRGLTAAAQRGCGEQQWQVEARAAVHRRDGNCLIGQHLARRRLCALGNQCALGDKHELDDDAGDVTSDNNACPLNADHLAGAQLKLLRHAAGSTHQVARMILDACLLHRCEQGLGLAVGHDDGPTNCHDGTTSSGVGADEHLEQRLLALAAVDQQIALDVVGGRPDQRVHQGA